MKRYYCPYHPTAKVVHRDTSHRCLACGMELEEPTPRVPRDAYDLPQALPSSPTPVVPADLQPTDCPRCNGAGEVVVFADEDRDVIGRCPLCEGAKTVTRATEAAWRIADRLPR